MESSHFVTDMAKLCSEAAAQPGLTGAAAAGTAPALDHAQFDRAEAAVARWYVACTRSRHERTVQTQLGSRGVDAFLPLYESLRHWHDRKKRILMPAFPGYVFVRMAFVDRLRVLSIPGVTRLVTFGSKPATIGDDEVERLRTVLAMRRAELHPYLASGRRVRIVSGPLRGLSGVVQRGQGLRMILSIDCVCRSVAVELHESDLQPE